MTRVLSLQHDRLCSYARHATRSYGRAAPGAAGEVSHGDSCANGAAHRANWSDRDCGACVGIRLDRRRLLALGGNAAACRVRAGSRAPCGDRLPKVDSRRKGIREVRARAQCRERAALPNAGRNAAALGAHAWVGWCGDSQMPTCERTDGRRRAERPSMKAMNPQSIVLMRRTVTAIIIVGGIVGLPELGTPSFFEESLRDHIDEQHGEVVDRLNALEQKLRAIEESQGGAATLMVQGRWYGWEHVTAFSSADLCESVRRMLRNHDSRVDLLLNGAAPSVADRATKCVLAGGQ